MRRLLCQESSVANTQKMFFRGTEVAGRQEMTAVFKALIDGLNWNDGNASGKKEQLKYILEAASGKKLPN